MLLAKLVMMLRPSVAVMRCVPPHARSAHHFRRKHHARSAHHVPRKRNTSFQKAKALLTKCFCFWRRHPDLNRGIEVLQTFALPLGHVALCLSDVSDYIIIFPFREYCYKKQGASLRPSFWSGLRGSNPPPSPWQGDALPNELSPRVVPPVGIEPTTRGFSVLCSTN